MELLLVDDLCPTLPSLGMPKRIACTPWESPVECVRFSPRTMIALTEPVTLMIGIPRDRGESAQRQLGFFFIHY